MFTSKQFILKSILKHNDNEKIEFFFKNKRKCIIYLFIILSNLLIYITKII